MSAIGDYIHLRTQNYNQWHINKINTTVGQDISSSYALIKQNTQDTIQINNFLLQAEELQDKYNRLIYGKTKDGKEIQPFGDIETQQKVFNILKQVLSQSFKKNIVSKVKRNGDNIIVAQENSRLKSQIRRIERINFNKTASYPQIQRKLQALLDHIKMGDWTKVGFNETQVSQDLKTLQQIAKNLNDKTGFQTEYPKSIYTLRRIAQLYSKFPNANEIRGTLFEFMIPLINMDLRTMAEQQIIDAIQKSNMGTSTYKVIIDPQTGKQLAPNSFDINNQKIKVNIVNDIRSKVDVAITFPGTKEKLNISAKTTKEFKSIKLQDESNLYRILSLSQNNDFITHVMNVFSTSNFDTQSIDSGDEQLAIKGMRMLIAKAAIQGFNAFDKVDMLIINDETQNFIHVYSAAVLIYGILATIENGTNNAGYGLSQSKINKIRQSFSQSGPEDRIQKTIKTYQGIKISTRVSASNINTAYETAKALLAQRG